MTIITQRSITTARDSNKHKPQRIRTRTANVIDCRYTFYYMYYSALRAKTDASSPLCLVVHFKLSWWCFLFFFTVAEMCLGFVCREDLVVMVLHLLSVFDWVLHRVGFRGKKENLCKMLVTLFYLLTASMGFVIWTSNLYEWRALICLNTNNQLVFR